MSFSLSAIGLSAAIRRNQVEFDVGASGKGPKAINVRVLSNAMQGRRSTHRQHAQGEPARRRRNAKNFGGAIIPSPALPRSHRSAPHLEPSPQASYLVRSRARPAFGFVLPRLDFKIIALLVVRDLVGLEGFEVVYVLRSWPLALFVVRAIVHAETV